MPAAISSLPKLSFFNVTGSTDSVAYASSANSSPATQGSMPEIFWIPVQNTRIGLQYTHFTKYLGARSNYDGHGRHASDNDTLFLYLWACGATPMTKGSCGASRI
jgi:hypothetical protein